jgi:hypothetical protein
MSSADIAADAESLLADVLMLLADVLALLADVLALLSDDPSKGRKPILLMLAMQQLHSSPMRQSDLVNSRDALSQSMEELVARDRLPLSHVQPRGYGYLFTFRASAGLLNWVAERPLLQEHFLLKSLKLDRYENHLVLARSAQGLYAGLCSWQDLPRAAVARPAVSRRCRLHQLGEKAGPTRKRPASRSTNRLSPTIEKARSLSEIL